MDGAIDAWMDAHADELIETARALVRIPTESHPPTGDEEAGQRFVRARLEELGAEVEWFTPDDVPALRAHPAYFPTINGRQRPFANRPDVVGTVRGSGGGRSALFSTHVDTVPAGSGWVEGTPFGGEVKDGRLYGRGSYDTKCALASHLFAVRCLREQGADLRGDVIVESVVDEEYGGSRGEAFDRARRARTQRELHADPDTAGHRPELIPTIRFLPGSSMPLDHPALGVLREAYLSLGTMAPRDFRLRGAPFACDAYIFNLYSPTPAVTLGPGGGGAHAPDEYVLTADLVDLAKICARFIWRWCR